MDNTITQEKILKYFNLTETALAIVKKKIVPGKEEYAKEIVEMVSNYLSDAKHFNEKGMWVDCFAALNYAHGWLDSGVRLEIFDVDDDKLFTVR